MRCDATANGWSIDARGGVRGEIMMIVLHLVCFLATNDVIKIGAKRRHPVDARCTPCEIA